MTTLTSTPSDSEEPTETTSAVVELPQFPQLPPIISPSILSADFSNLALDCEMVLNAGADRLHCDIMDGHFVPNISFGAPIVNSLSKALPGTKLDCHLMVSHPNRWITPLAKAGATGITFHIESVSKSTDSSSINAATPYIVVGNVVSTDIDPNNAGSTGKSQFVDVAHPDSIKAAINTLKQITKANMTPGLAIKPNTAVGDWLGKILDSGFCKLLLIMTVEPGFGGQSFMYNQMEKVKSIRHKYPELEIQVDGGLNATTAKAAVQAGANNIVAGSYIFKHSRPFTAVSSLLEAFSIEPRPLAIPTEESSPLPTPSAEKWKTTKLDNFWVKFTPESDNENDNESLVSDNEPEPEPEYDDTILITKRFVTKAMKYLFDKAYDNNSALLVYDSLRRASFKSMEPLLSQATKILTIGRPIDAQIIQSAPNLSRIATYSIGTDHIDKKLAADLNIQVKNLSDLSNSCANATVTLLLAVLRRLNESQRAVKTGIWHPWISEHLCSKIQLEGATIGCVGLGGIGFRFAQIMHSAWNCKVFYHTRNVNHYADSIFATHFSNLKEMISQCDIVSLHCPLTPETKNLISKDIIQAMKPGTILINTARGAVVDQDALIEAIKSGHLGGCGLDVVTPEPLPPRHPLLDFPNVIVTPHNASAEYPTRLSAAKETIDNLFN